MSLAQLLLSRPVASRARVVRVPGFFSEADIAAVLAVRDRHHQLYGAPQLARRGWATTYLSAGGLFRAHAPELVARLSALPRRVDLTPFAGRADRRDGDDDARALLDGLAVRCAELHEGAPGGSLSDPKHFDNGSVVTVDVLLADGFEGGAFSTLERDGELIAHAFERGDALVFPSYKYHSVAPITSGVRRTLVLEFWQGDENRCNHRCELVRPAGAPPRLCADARTAHGCADVVVVRFAEPGTLGCGFAFADAADAANRDASAIQDGRPVLASVNELRPGTQAAAHPQLALGLELTHVAGADVGGLGFDELDAALARASLDAGRPVELRFKRPTPAPWPFGAQ